MGSRPRQCMDGMANCLGCIFGCPFRCELGLGIRQEASDLKFTLGLRFEELVRSCLGYPMKDGRCWLPIIISARRTN